MVDGQINQKEKIMAASKKSSTLQVAKSKLQEAKKSLMSQKKESQQKINALKSELKQKVTDAMLQGYEKGHLEASKEKEKYIQEREKAINSALVNFNKKFKTNVFTKSKKVAAKKSAAKKVVAKKSAVKKVVVKKAIAKKK